MFHVKRPRRQQNEVNGNSFRDSDPASRAASPPSLLPLLPFPAAVARHCHEDPHRATQRGQRGVSREAIVKSTRRTPRGSPTDVSRETLCGSASQPPTVHFVLIRDDDATHLATLQSPLTTIRTAAFCRRGNHPIEHVRPTAGTAQAVDIDVCVKRSRDRQASASESAAGFHVKHLSQARFPAGKPFSRSCQRASRQMHGLAPP